MKKKNRAQLITLIVTTWTLTAATQSVPSLINYQGRLTDQTGAPLPVGNYGLEFRLWDSPAGTNLIWGQRQNVSVQAGGVFNVILGAAGGNPVTNPVPAVNDLAFAFGASNRFLGVTIVLSNGVPQVAGEIAPRQQLLAAPFSMLAQNLAQASLKAASVDPGFLLDILQPPGTISAFGGTNIPGGWLLCDGRAASSAQYPRLYAAIGTSWGAGSGGTDNFNLPDLRGRFLRGVDGLAGNDPDRTSRTAPNPGGNSGNAVGSLQADELKSHHHLIKNTGTAGANYSAAVRTDVAANISITDYDVIQPTGGAETRPKNAYVNYIIKY